MPARVVVFGGDSASCINTELNTVGTPCPGSPLLSVLLLVPGALSGGPSACGAPTSLPPGRALLCKLGEWNQGCGGA